jgi:hypothetical protein
MIPPEVGQTLFGENDRAFPNSIIHFGAPEYHTKNGPEQVQTVSPFGERPQSAAATPLWI